MYYNLFLYLLKYALIKKHFYKTDLTIVLKNRRPNFQRFLVLFFQFANIDIDSRTQVKNILSKVLCS